MKAKNFFVKLFRHNAFVKPLSVVIASGPTVGYLLSNMSELFVAEPIQGTDLMAVSTELIKSFQGSLVLLILLISVISVYKPSKIVIGSLVFAGMALAASALLKTLGVTFLTYGVGQLLNNATLSRIITRNDNLKTREIETEVERIIKEGQR